MEAIQGQSLDCVRTYVYIYKPERCLFYLIGHELSSTHCCAWRAIVRTKEEWAKARRPMGWETEADAAREKWVWRSRTMRGSPSRVAAYGMVFIILSLKHFVYFASKVKHFPLSSSSAVLLSWPSYWFPFISLTSKCESVLAVSRWLCFLSLSPPLMISYRLMALNIIYMLTIPTCISPAWTSLLECRLVYQLPIWHLYLDKMYFKFNIFKSELWIDSV